MKLNIPDMSCQTCINKITKILDSNLSIKNYEIMADERNIIINLNDNLNEEIALNDLQESLSDIGYDATKID